MSHLVVALTSLGASEERIREVAESYSKKLEPPSHFSIDAHQYPIVTLDGVLAFRGVRRQFYDLEKYYKDEIEERGVEGALKEYLPHLLGGSPGAAFHTLIQLGYAYNLHKNLVDSTESEVASNDIAEGLAYLTHSNLSFSGAYEISEDPVSPNTSKKFGDPCAQVAAAVPQILSAAAELQPILALELRANSELQHLHLGQFQRGMAAFTKSLSLGSGLDNIVEDCKSVFGALAQNHGSERLVEVVCHMAAETHRLTGAKDFFILHGLTAAWSLLQLAPLLSPGLAVYSCTVLLRGIAAAYVVQDCPDVVCAESISVSESWEDIMKKATSLDADEHLYKGVHVLHSLSQREGLKENDEFYRALAVEVCKKTSYF